MSPTLLLPLVALLPLAACEKDGEDVDADGDGFAPPADCDDGNAAANPDATEVCANGVDDDCDGLPGACRQTGTLTADEADVTIVGAIQLEHGPPHPHR